LPKCIMCGKYFELDSDSVDLNPYADLFENQDEDPLFGKESETSKTKPASICKMCQAKLKRDAEDAQKTPKPM